MTRANLRAAIASILASAFPAITIYQKRLVDTTDVDEFLQVYVSEGVVGEFVTAQEIVAEVVVAYNSISADDDALDAIMNTAEAAIVGSLAAEIEGLPADGFQFIQKTAFAYDTSESTQFNRLAYSFQVTYHE